MKISNPIRRCSATAILVFCAGGTLAQELVIEEITVTATKRPESMQDIPISVSAFTADAIEEAGVKDVRDIAAQTPGLSIKSRGDTEASVFIRGIGSQAPGIGADPAVGIYIDGLYAARGTNATAAFFDVERIEVVKGPQGTLFGRNASAGAISIITKKPEIGDNYGSALVGFGDEGQQKYEFIYNASLSDSLAIRVGAKHDERDGLYTNGVTGKELNGRDNTNARLALLYDNGSTYSMNLSYEYVDSTNTAAFVTTDDSFAEVVRMDDAPADQTMQSSRVNWTNNFDFSDSLSLTSITGYFDLDANVTPVDADLVEFFVATFEEPQTAEMFSQEFRLNGSSGALDWFVGASYAKEDLSFVNDLAYDEFVVADIFGLNAADVGDGDACNGTIDFGDGSGPINVPVCITAHERPSGDAETKSVAAYGDLTWHLSDLWDLSAGLRYTKDDKTMAYNNPPTGGLLSGLDGQIFGTITPGVQNADTSYNSTDPRVALNFHITDGTMLYASGAKGYKSGGLNRQFDPVEQAILPFDKEESTAYELGIKTSLWGGRGQINAAVFKTDYQNYQLEELTNLVPQINNVGDADVSGLDMDFRFLLSDAFEVWGSFAWLDAEMVNAVDPTREGKTMPQAPETSGSLSGKWSVPAGSGDFDLSATWAYSDSFFFDLANDFEQPSYSTIGARVAWANETWGVALMGDNLTDEEYLTERFLFLDVSSIRAPGRLVMLQAHLNF